MTSSSTLKLLAIDDDARGLEVIELALRRQGLDIMTSQDPDEGFEMFLRTRPKIVLLDLVMPKVSGIAADRRRGRRAPHRAGPGPAVPSGRRHRLRAPLLRYHAARSRRRAGASRHAPGNERPQALG